MPNHIDAFSAQNFRSVAEELTKRHLKTSGGKYKWNRSTVRSILTNEKYKGDALLQKEFTVDFLQKKHKKNEGEVPQYYVEENHEAIIDPQVFDLVQAELARRTKGGRYSGVSIFSNKIRCADCGGWYGSKIWHSTDQYRKVIYRCNRKYDNKEKNCRIMHVTEDEIKAAFVSAFNQRRRAQDFRNSSKGWKHRTASSRSLTSGFGAAWLSTSRSAERRK